MEIPFELISDGKGYLDRECPNENCEFVFKIYMGDWLHKVSEKVFCPRCGHIASHEQWWTQDQLNNIENMAMQYFMGQIQNRFQKSFRKLSNQSNKYFQITYKPGKRISFQNNPIGQREEWELEIHCEHCETRTSVIGTAYFCPCCGINAVDRLFNESLDRIRKQLSSLYEMQTMLEGIHDRDTAVTISQNLVETSLKDVVSAYQKFAVETFRKGSTKNVSPNDFQIVDKGSNLFEKHFDKGYQEWLSNEELHFMNLMFQRRHILEHNQGIIDEKYLQRSKDKAYRLGQRLISKKDEVEELIDIIKKLATGISIMVDI